MKGFFSKAVKRHSTGRKLWTEYLVGFMKLLDMDETDLLDRGKLRLLNKLGSITFSKT